MADPVFNSGDRVNQGSLPTELQGKTPQEVAAYYQNREVQITSAAERAIAMASAGEQPPTPQPPPQPRTPEQQQTDANFVSRSEWNQMAPVVQKGLITQAKLAAAQGKPYWEKFKAQIEDTISKCDPMLQMQEDIWVTAYNEIVGRNFSTIQAEESAAAAAAAARSAMTVEPPSGGFTQAELTKPLSPGEQKVANGLGLSPEAYRKGQERLATNKFPITTDNRRIA